MGPWLCFVSNVHTCSAMQGVHKGPVTCICLPNKGDGELGAAGLLLSASVDGTIKIWNYQGKVTSEPTVCVQTLYGKRVLHTQCVPNATQHHAMPPCHDALLRGELKMVSWLTGPRVTTNSYRNCFGLHIVPFSSLSVVARRSEQEPPVCPPHADAVSPSMAGGVKVVHVHKQSSHMCTCVHKAQASCCQ